MKKNTLSKSVEPQRQADAAQTLKALKREQMAAGQVMALAMPYNTGKARELGRENAVAPPAGAHVGSPSPTTAASTLTDINTTGKSQALDRKSVV